MSSPVISIDQSSDSGGFLSVILGPMFSGKTDYLLRELHIFATMGVKVLYVNHLLDTRDGIFSSHNEMITQLGNGINGIKLSDSNDIVKEAADHLIIGIDEAQFFHGLKDVVLHLVEKLGKRVIVTGLSGTYQREPFGEIVDLIPYCDNLVKLNSYCTLCASNKILKHAHFSYRSDTNDTDKIVVGAKNEYMPLCRTCFLSKHSKT
jgi:thymidine kinase